MKRLLVITALLSSIGMSCYVQADSTAGQTNDRPTKEVGKDCPQQEIMDIYWQIQGMLKEVGLSDTQNKEIAGIIQAEKARVASVQKNIEKNYNDLLRTAFAAQYDQTKYNSIIEKLSGLNKQIIVEHSQMIRDISTKLTNEQREKILKLIPNKTRQQRRSGFGFGFGNFGF